jgi:hypothetical protein
MTTADEFHTQNQFIQDLKTNYSTSNTKTIYLNEQISSLINVNKWLFWVFILFAILFSIFCFLSSKMKSWSTTKKIIIVFIVLLYPFYIYYIEKYLLIIGTYIKDMFMGNVYASPDF